MRLPMLLRLLWLLLARVTWCMSRRLTSAILGVPPSPSCSALAQCHAGALLCSKQILMLPY